MKRFLEAGAVDTASQHAATELKNGSATDAASLIAAMQTHDTSTQADRLLQVLVNMKHTHALSSASLDIVDAAIQDLS